MTQAIKPTAAKGHLRVTWCSGPDRPGHTQSPPIALLRWLPPSEGFLKGDVISTTLFSRGTRDWVTPAHPSQLEPRGHASQLCVQCPPWKLELANLWGNLHHGRWQALQTGCFSPWSAGCWTLASATQLLKLQNSKSRRKPNTPRQRPGSRGLPNTGCAEHMPGAGWARAVAPGGNGPISTLSSSQTSQTKCPVSAIHALGGPTVCWALF